MLSSLQQPHKRHGPEHCQLPSFLLKKRKVWKKRLFLSQVLFLEDNSGDHATSLSAKCKRRRGNCLKMREILFKLDDELFGRPVAGGDYEEAVLRQDF